MFLFDNVDETHNTHNIDCTNAMFPCIRTRPYHKICRFQLVYLDYMYRKAHRTVMFFLKKTIKITRNTKSSRGGVPRPRAYAAGVGAPNPALAAGRVPGDQAGVPYRPEVGEPLYMPLWNTCGLKMGKLRYVDLEKLYV